MKGKDVAIGKVFRVSVRCPLVSASKDREGRVFE
jgi:hypothetical protein